MLCLQAQRRVQLIRLSPFALDRAVQEVSAVKLNSRLIGQNFKNSSATRIIKLGSFHQFSSAAVEHPVVVIATPAVKLFVFGVDARSNSGGFAKIERSPFHRFQLSRRNQARVHGGKARCLQRELMAQNVTLACEIEIGVIRKIDHSVFVRGGGILNAQVSLYQCVPNHSRQIAWISSLAVFAEISQLHAVRDGLGLPDHVVEAVRPAVKGVFAVVERQRIFLAIQRKAAVPNAIPVAADDGSEKRGGWAIEVSRVPVEIIEPQHHIRRPAVAVGSFQRNHNAAVVCDSSFVRTIAQRENLDRSAIGYFPKRLACHFCFSLRTQSKQGKTQSARRDHSQGLLYAHYCSSNDRDERIVSCPVYSESG